jgi:hypothetical protein
LLGRAERCGHNIELKSPPAWGKTWQITEYARMRKQQDPQFHFEVWDGGTMAPTDGVMSVPDMEAMVMRKIYDGTLPNYYKTPELCGIIYVGEKALMGLETSRGFQKMWNHEDVGGNFRIPPHVIFVGDGNRIGDKSGVKVESRANQSRFLSFNLELDIPYMVEAVKSKHERVAAFGIRNPTMIDNYKEVFENPKLLENDLLFQEGKQGIWASLRSWDRVSNIMTDVETSGVALMPEEIPRSIGSGMAAAFHSFNMMLDNITTLEDIVADPKKASVSKLLHEQYAISTMLAYMVNRNTFVPIATYMQRYQNEMQVCFFNLMNERLKKVNDEHTSFIHSCRDYKLWVTAPHISKLINGVSK